MGGRVGGCVVAAAGDEEDSSGTLTATPAAERLSKKGNCLSAILVE